MRVKNMEQKKRIHYRIPGFRKIYSAYDYNQQKYNKIYKKLQQLALKYDDENIFFRVDKFKVLYLCYLKDDENKRVTLGDSKHIYRYSTIQKISSLIASVLMNKYHLKVYKQKVRYKLYSRFKIYFDFDNSFVGHYCELVDNIRDDSIKNRILLNIAFLHSLRLGIRLDYAVKLAKLKYQNCK